MKRPDLESPSDDDTVLVDVVDALLGGASSPAPAPFLPVRPPLRLRSYRTAADGAATVFYTSVDAQIPLVDGVTVVCGDNDEVAEIVNAASVAGLAAVSRRWPDGRRALLIQDRQAGSAS